MACDSWALTCRKAAYDQAESLAQEGEYSAADHLLERLGTYADSAQMRIYYDACRLEKTGEYAAASAKYTELGDFRDAKARAVNVLEHVYTEAEELFSSGDPIAAILLYEKLGDYKDSAERAHRRLEPVEEDLPPDDYSGMEIRISADLVSSLQEYLPLTFAPEGDGNMCSAPLPEETARQLLEQARPFAYGPDGAVLYYCGLMVIRRGNTITPLLQAVSRGREDTLGWLKYQLDELRKKSGSGSFVRWSPDGRYMFVNSILNTSKYPVFLTDTITGEIFLPEETPAGSDPSDRPLCGRFSRDGKSFYYAKLTSSPISCRLMRYDLETGELETCYESDAGEIRELCEMGEGRLLLSASGVLLRLCNTCTPLPSEARSHV